MSNENVKRIEASIQEAKRHLELKNALDRLTGNRDFKKIILDGYFREEAVRLVHLKSDPSMQTPERQASVVNDINAIGALASFFRTVEFNAGLAEKEIKSGEESLEEIALGEMSNG